MKITKRLLSFLLVIVMLTAFAIPSYAASLTFNLMPDFKAQTLSVWGNSDAGRMLTFYVTDRGVSAKDVTFNNNFYAMDQETVKADGTFDITLRLPETMTEGNYKIIIGGLGENFAEADRSREFEYMLANGKAYILEAESATGLDKWTTKSDSKASGGAYVSIFQDGVSYDPSEAKITFNFEVEEAMEYDIFALVHNPAEHTSTHSFSVNNDNRTTSTNLIGEQVYAGMFTGSQSYSWPMHWAKIRSNQSIGAGPATITYQPNLSSLFPERLLAAIDAIYVVPSDWNWEPFETTTPVDETRLNVILNSATLKSAETARGATLGVTLMLTLPAKVSYNVPVWAEMRYKGELVARERMSPSNPMTNWLTNFSNKVVLNIDVPVVAPDGEYEIYCGLGSKGTFANVDGEKFVGTVTIGELDDPNPDVLAISDAEATQNGKELNVTYTLSEGADVDSAKAFVRFWDGNVLWGVAETEEAIDVQTVGEELTAVFAMPAGMPSGTYEAELGFYNVNGTKTIGDMDIVSDKKNDYKPLSHGIYKAQKTGRHHFWYINQAGAAIWDGEPFIPMGGMYCPNILAGYSFTDPASNISNWNEDMREIAILVENGVTDLYLNSSIIGSPNWVWEYVLDYLDERGIRYGIQPNGGNGYTEQDSFYIFSNTSKISTQFYTMGAGKKEVTYDKTLSTIGSATPKYAICTVVNTSGKAVYAGIAEMTKGSEAGNFNFKATVNVPSLGIYTAYFTPIVNKSGSVVNFWKYGEQMIARAEKFARNVAIGDGVRDIIDHATNESGYYNQNANQRPYDDAYNAMYEEWLKNKYSSVAKLNTAWATSGITSFEQASKIIPVYTGSANSNSDYSIVGYEVESDAMFTFDGRKTAMWLDFIEFRDFAAAEFYNDLADAYKTKLDVPVVIKSVYYHMENFKNQRLSGGIDGLGSESYSVGEGVGQRHMVAYGLTNQFAKTGWSIVTETNTEENITKKHADAYGATPTRDENGKLVVVDPTAIGYGTKERMFTNFDQLFDSGAKGIYDFVFSARHSGTIQEVYTYIYIEDHIKEKYGNDQFAWLEEYSEDIYANAEKIANTPIEKNVIYFMSPVAYTNMGGPDRFNAVHIADHKWVNYSYKASGTNKPYAILLTEDPNVNTQYIAANFERGPVSTKQGVAFGNMVENMPEDKAALYLGFRYDLGTVPQIDKYFTNEFTKNSAGVKVQVLNPGATGEVIWEVNGKPWAIRDGNLWIVSAEDWHNKTSYGNPGTLKYIDEIGIFMDSEDMVMQDYGFVDNTGAEIDKVTAGDATLNVRIKNNTEDAFDAVMYAASYDSAGKLIDVSKKTRTLFSGLNYIETGITLDGSESFARGFIWDSSMKPLSDVLKIEK